MNSVLKTNFNLSPKQNKQKKKPNKNFIFFKQNNKFNFVFKQTIPENKKNK